MAKTVLFHIGGWSIIDSDCGKFVAKACPNMFTTAAHLGHPVRNITNQINLQPHAYYTAMEINSYNVSDFWARLNDLQVGDTAGMVVIPPKHVVNHYVLTTEPYKDYLRGAIKDPLAQVVDLGISNVVTFDLVEQLYVGTFNDETKEWTFPCAPSSERTLISDFNLKGVNGVNGVADWAGKLDTPTVPIVTTGSHNWLVYGFKVKTLPAASTGLKLSDLSTYIDISVNVTAHDSPSRSI